MIEPKASGLDTNHEKGRRVAVACVDYQSAKLHDERDLLPASRFGRQFICGPFRSGGKPDPITDRFHAHRRRWISGLPSGHGA